jgi:hypothetical protein
MPEDVIPAESSPASTDGPSDAALEALAAGDTAKYNTLENAREIAARSGKALETSPTSKTSVKAADPEPANPDKSIQEPKKAPKTGEDRKAELHAEIQDLLKQRDELKKPGVKVAETPPAKVEPPAEKKPPAAAKADGPVEPQLEDFDTFKLYKAADKAYQAEMVKLAIAEALAASDQQKAIAAANKKIQDDWTEKVAEATEEHADFAEVAFSADTPITPVMDKFILRCGIGPKVLYRLGENAGAEGKRIAKLDDFDAIEALVGIRNEINGKAKATPLRDRELPPVKKHIAAPPPATDLGGRNSEPADRELAALNRGDTAEYMRLANAREMRAHTG